MLRTSVDASFIGLLMSPLAWTLCAVHISFPISVFAFVTITVCTFVAGSLGASVFPSSPRLSAERLSLPR